MNETLSNQYREYLLAKQREYRLTLKNIDEQSASESANESAEPLTIDEMLDQIGDIVDNAKINGSQMSSQLNVVDSQPPINNELVCEQPKQRLCSACGNVGHNRSNKLCKKFKKTQKKRKKEKKKREKRQREEEGQQSEWEMIFLQEYVNTHQRENERENERENGLEIDVYNERADSEDEKNNSSVVSDEQGGEQGDEYDDGVYLESKLDVDLEKWVHKNNVACIICLQGFKLNENVVRMQCACLHHSACVKKWWKTKGDISCPVPHNNIAQ